MIMISGIETTENSITNTNFFQSICKRQTHSYLRYLCINPQDFEPWLRILYFSNVSIACYYFLTHLQNFIELLGLIL